MRWARAMTAIARDRLRRSESESGCVPFFATKCFLSPFSLCTLRSLDIGRYCMGCVLSRDAVVAAIGTRVGISGHPVAESGGDRTRTRSAREEERVPIPLEAYAYGILQVRSFLFFFNLGSTIRPSQVVLLVD